MAEKARHCHSHRTLLLNVTVGKQNTKRGEGCYSSHHELLGPSTIERWNHGTFGRLLLCVAVLRKLVRPGLSAIAQE